MHPTLDLGPGIARDVADGLPPLVDRAERGPRGLEVRDREQLLGLDGQLLLAGQVLPLLGVTLGEGLAARLEEDVLRTAEAVPQVVLVLALRPAGGLPVGHQLAVAGGGGAPVRRLRQRLGLLDQLLLGLTGLLALCVQRGEMRLAPLGERRAGVREAVPQLVVRLAVQPRQALPRVDQRPQPLTRRPPLLAGRQLLGLGDQLLLGQPGLVALLGLLRLALLAPRFDGLDELVQPLPQCLQIADRMVLVDLVPQMVDGGLGVLRRQVGGLDPALEEADLDDQALILALEVGEGLLGSTRLPRSDDLLAVGGTHVHGPRLIDAAPWVAAHSASST